MRESVRAREVGKGECKTREIPISGKRAKL